MSQSSMPPSASEKSIIPEIESAVIPMVIVEPHPTILRAVADLVNLHLPGLKLSRFSNGQDSVDALADPNTDVHMLVTALEMEGGDGIHVVQHAFKNNVQHVALMTDRDLGYLRRVFGKQVINELLDQGLEILTKPHLRELDEAVIDPLRAKFAPRSS